MAIQANAAYEGELLNFLLRYSSFLIGDFVFVFSLSRISIFLQLNVFTLV